MISRVLRNKKAIRRILGNDKKTSHLVPSWQDLEILECLNATLAPLKEFTDILSGSKYGLYRYVTRTNIPFFDH